MAVLRRVARFGSDMPDVPYLSGGESPTAAGMNVLFAEADRRVALALDNHSPLYLLTEDATQSRQLLSPYIGPTFQFVGGPQPISGYYGTWSYDHSVFQNAMAAAVPVASDEATRILLLAPFPAATFTSIGKVRSMGNASWFMSPSLLRFSLEAHRKSFTPAGGVAADYWIQETNTDAGLNIVDLQRIENYEQAELVFEGRTELEFKAEWNKYNFFRIHNLNPSLPVEVTFLNTSGVEAHAVIVPPCSVRCVRRTGVDGAYTDGFKYFQKFLPDDPRFYQHGNANNVTNPSRIIPFINHLLGGRRFRLSVAETIVIARPTVMLDPHVRAELPEGYAYGDPAVESTLLGDLLHHRGSLLDVKTVAADPVNTIVTSIAFNGYGQMAGVFDTREVGDDLQIKSLDTANQHDFVSLSTNLLCTGGGTDGLVEQSRLIYLPVRDASQWITLDRTMPSGWAFKMSMVAQTATTTVGYFPVVNDSGGLGATVTQSIATVTYALGTFYPVETLTPHKSDVADVLEPLAGAVVSTFTSSRLALTSGGLCLLTTQTIPLAQFRTIAGAFHREDLFNNLLAASVIDPFELISGDGPYVELQYNEPEEPGVEPEPVAFVVKRALVFRGYGFPDTDLGFYTGFLTPRVTRIYSDRQIVSGNSGDHYDFIEGALNLDGRRAFYIGDTAQFQDTDIAVLSPWSAPSDVQNVIGTLSNSDVLYAATKNCGRPGYWNGSTGPGTFPWETNRKRCGANLIFRNSPLDGSDISMKPSGGFLANRMFRFVRMELAVEHFNNMAAKVNSIKRIKPLNWIDHGVVQNGTDQTRRYRLRPNKYGIFDEILKTPFFNSLPTASRSAYISSIHQYSGMRPLSQYGAQMNSVPEIAQYAGLPIYGLDDLPGFTLAANSRSRYISWPGVSNFQVPVNQISSIVTNRTFLRVGPYEPYNRTTGETFVNAVHRESILHTIEPVFQWPTTPSLTETQNLLRPDLAALRNGPLPLYRWVKTEDVEAYAESLGYVFAKEDFGVTFDLEVIESVPALTVSGSTFQLSESREFGLAMDEDIVPPRTITSLTGDLPAINGLQNGFYLDTRFAIFVRAEGGEWIADVRNPVVVPSLGPDELSFSPTVSFVRSSYENITTFQRSKYAIAFLTNQNIGMPGSPPFPTADFPVRVSPAPCQYYDDFTAAPPGYWIKLYYGTKATYIQVSPFNAQVNAKVKWDLPENVRASMWPVTYGQLAMNSARNPRDYTSDQVCDFVDFNSLIPNGGGVLMKMEEPWFEFTPDFSAVRKNALARRAWATNVLPFTAVAGGAFRVKLWRDFSSPV